MPNDVREAIAGEVRAELARKRKTQREAAAAIGIDQSAFWQRLEGKRPFKAEEISALAQFLDVDPAKFFLADTPAAPASSGTAAA